MIRYAGRSRHRRYIWRCIKMSGGTSWTLCMCACDVRQSTRLKQKEKEAQDAGKCRHKRTQKRSYQLITKSSSCRETHCFRTALHPCAFYHWFPVLYKGVYCDKQQQAAPARKPFGPIFYKGLSSPVMVRCSYLSSTYHETDSGVVGRE
jgi:hypothetical protein